MESDLFTQPEEQPLPRLEDGTDDREPEIVQANQRSGLKAIKHPEVQLVTWRRKLSRSLQDWLEHPDQSRLPDLRLLLYPAQLRLALETLLDKHGMPRDAERSELIDDIDGLVSVFADIAATDLVDVRLERVGHDACWKFHRDCVEARLVTTYLGPATEWIKPPYAEEALENQKQFQGPIERFRPHDVGMFKGSCADSGSGIVHRSPPIEGTGQMRLFLCLNKPSLASPMRWSGGPRY